MPLGRILLLAAGEMESIKDLEVQFAKEAVCCRGWREVLGGRALHSNPVSLTVGP